MDVDFPWEWAEVNIFGKLRKQDEQGSFVGSDPGDAKLYLIEKLA